MSDQRSVTTATDAGARQRTDRDRSLRGGDYFCGRCGQTKADAVAYCRDCHEYFCGDCLRQHNASQATKSHKLNSVPNGVRRSNSPVSVAKQAQAVKCEKHKSEIVSMFCTKHMALCCDACVKADHSTCGQDIKYIPTISTAVENTVEYENTKQHMQNLIERFEEVKLEKKMDLEALRNDRDRFLLSVREMKLEITEMLDQIESEAREVADAFCQLESDEISHYKKRVDSLIVSLKKTYEGLKPGNATNDNQMFVNMKQVSKDINKFENLLGATHRASKRVNFTFWLNKELTTMVDLTRQLRDRSSLVHLPTANSSEQNPVSKLHARAETNCKGPPLCLCSKPYKHKVLTSSGEFSVRVAKGDQEKCNITQCRVLTTGHLVMVDSQNKAIKLFDNEFQCRSRYRCTSKPFDIAITDRSNAVVSLPDEKTLQMVSIMSGPNKKQLKAGKTINMAKKCFGVAFVRGQLVVTCGSISNSEVRIMDLQGNIIKRFYSPQGLEAFRSPRNVLVDRDVVYVSDPYANTVTGLTVDGTVVGQYQNTALRHPAGMCSDSDGNVYICGRQSNNIHQISSKLKVHQIFTSKAFEVLQPQAVSFSPSDGRIVVTMENSDTAEVFKMV